MYPDNLNNSVNPQPSGIDYLNQIATPPPAQGFDKKTKLILAIIGLFGIISLVAIFIMSQGSSSASPIQVAARVNKLLTISQKYDKKLQTSTMQAINISFVSVLTSAEAGLTEPLQNSGIDYKKQKKEIAKMESSEKMDKKLEDAALNAQLDSIYAHEMNVQITDTLVMMQKLQKSTRSKSTKEYLVKTVADLKNIQKQLEEFLKTN